MYALAVKEDCEQSPGMIPADDDKSSRVSENQLPERWQLGQFDGTTGLSAVRELAVALGLVEIDDLELWEHA
jgi:hypothetical protein